MKADNLKYIAQHCWSRLKSSHDAGIFKQQLGFYIELIKTKARNRNVCDTEAMVELYNQTENQKTKAWILAAMHNIEETNKEKI